MFNVSAAPHIRSGVRTEELMTDVCIALIPSVCFGIYHFGFRALLIISVSIITCVMSEYIYEKLLGRKVTVNDMSAFLTGLLLGLNLSVYVPLWIPVVGGVFAIIIVKQLFGGLGRNFMNPALAARCFLLIAYSRQMTEFFVDGESGATPLMLIKTGGSVNISDMFIGTTAGCIGETSVPAILIGAVYLIARRVIPVMIPLSCIGSFVLFMTVYGIMSQGSADPKYIAMQLCGGGLLFGAVFMATDYVTSPVTPAGRIVYGICIGTLTGIFRLSKGLPEGVSYAIICSNMIVPLIEKCTMPVPFGEEKRNIWLKDT